MFLFLRVPLRSLRESILQNRTPPFMRTAATMRITPFTGGGWSVSPMERSLSRSPLSWRWHLCASSPILRSDRRPRRSRRRWRLSTHCGCSRIAASSRQAGGIGDCFACFANPPGRPARKRPMPSTPRSLSSMAAPGSRGMRTFWNFNPRACDWSFSSRQNKCRCGAEACRGNGRLRGALE